VQAILQQAPASAAAPVAAAVVARQQAAAVAPDVRPVPRQRANGPAGLAPLQHRTAPHPQQAAAAAAAVVTAPAAVRGGAAASAARSVPALQQAHRANATEPQLAVPHWTGPQQAAAPVPTPAAAVAQHRGGDERGLPVLQREQRVSGAARQGIVRGPLHAAQAAFDGRRQQAEAPGAAAGGAAAAAAAAAGAVQQQSQRGSQLCLVDRASLLQHQRQRQLLSILLRLRRSH
jgi:hypothetical protein